MDIRIHSRIFSNQFDITTPIEHLSTKTSPFGETLLLNASGTQIARLAKSSLVNNHVYDIIISGGGYYQFSRDKDAKRTWACAGEGRLLHLAQIRWRRFEIADENQKIAECWKDWAVSDYTLSLLIETEMKLVICIILALNLSQKQSTYIAG